MTKLSSEKLVVLPKRLEMGNNYAIVAQLNGAAQIMGAGLGAAQVLAQGNLAVVNQFSWH